MMSTKTAVTAPSPMMKEEKSRSVLGRDGAPSAAPAEAVTTEAAAV